MKDMAVSATEPVLSDVGQDALSQAGVSKDKFDQEAQKAEQSPEIKKMVDAAMADGELSEQEQDQIGAKVADKALEAMGVNFDGLNEDQKMALADYCGNCLDGQANEAVDETAGQSAETVG